MRVESRDRVWDISEYLPHPTQATGQCLTRIIGQDKSGEIREELNSVDRERTDCLILKKSPGGWKQQDIVDNGCLFHEQSTKTRSLHLDRPRTYTVSTALMLQMIMAYVEG